MELREDQKCAASHFRDAMQTLLMFAEEALSGKLTQVTTQLTGKWTEL